MALLLFTQCIKLAINEKRYWYTHVFIAAITGTTTATTTTTAVVATTTILLAVLLLVLLVLLLVVSSQHIFMYLSIYFWN